MRGRIFALGALAGSLSLGGDAHATSCFSVNAETAVLELEEFRVNGVLSAAPAGYAGAELHVYRNLDGTLQFGAKRPPNWLWDERFEP